jgi:hypothetical protein
MIKTTKEQRATLLAKFKRSRLKQRRNTLLDRNYAVYDEINYSDYRSFRRHVQGTYCMDGAITVQWCNMWLCIEKDGYCHT